jgi:hypothetical protein
MKNKDFPAPKFDNLAINSFLQNDQYKYKKPIIA